jgi:hypothetical protein
MKRIQMKYIGRDLLILLISLFILSSCQTSDEIGLDVKPADQISGTLIDSTTAKTTTVVDEPLIGKGLYQQPLGILNDPELGETQANVAMALALPLTDLKLTNLPVLDSAILVLKYGTEFYGTPGAYYTINVHQLNEKFRGSETYLNTKEWDHNSEVIGSKTVIGFNMTDSLSIFKRRTAKFDTIVKVGPQLRIPLKSSFVISNLLKSDTANFHDNTRFNNYFKGLYLTMDRNSDPNGMVFFDFKTDSISGLDLYYKTTNGIIIDTIDAHFAISRDSTVSNIRHTFSPKVQAQLNNPNQNFEKVYVQPLSGLRAKVTFPYINKLKALGNIIVNKAELVVTLADGSDAVFGSAPRLTFYRTDIADQRQFLPDNNGTDARSLSDANFGGYYDSTKRRYVFTVTAYIQDILNGKLQQYNTYLAPVFTSSDKSVIALPEGTGSTAERSILNSGSLKLPDGTPSPYRLKLNITYTKLNL